MGSVQRQEGRQPALHGPLVPGQVLAAAGDWRLWHAVLSQRRGEAERSPSAVRSFQVLVTGDWKSYRYLINRPSSLDSAEVEHNKVLLLAQPEFLHGRGWGCQYNGVRTRTQPNLHDGSEDLAARTVVLGTERPGRGVRHTQCETLISWCHSGDLPAWFM